MMRIEITENIEIEQKYNLFENGVMYFNLTNPIDQGERWMGYNPTRIRIKDKWYDTIPLHILARTKAGDGYYRFIYIQINMANNEYYIGKVNRKKWKEITKYQGSGLLFKSKYSKHKDEFVRYFIASCDSQEETERLEAEIVDDQLLKDKKCLNLVRGGGGTNEHNNSEEKRKKQKEYMKNHPERYQKMVETAHELYCSGNTVQLEKRGQSIKATMSAEKYRKMSRERIFNWKEQHPEEYEKSRENNKLAVRTEESRSKKSASLKKWREENPQKAIENERKSLMARTSPKANKKRAESLKEFNRANPEKARENTRKRSEASVKVCQKGVNMLDLETGEVIMSFDSQHDAARWLVEKGIAKNTNCASSISAVCRKQPCDSGYGFRKKAYGFGWTFRD